MYNNTTYLNVLTVRTESMSTAFEPYLSLIHKLKNLNKELKLLFKMQAMGFQLWAPPQFSVAAPTSNMYVCMYVCVNAFMLQCM